MVNRATYTTKIKKSTEDHISKKSEFILISAGESKRLGNYGPKQLLNIDGEILINRQLGAIRQHFPESEIFVVLGYRKYDILSAIDKTYKARCIFHDTYDKLNIVKGIELGLSCCITKSIYIMMGDMFFEAPSIQSVGETVEHSSCIYYTDNELLNKDSIGVRHKNDKLIHMCFDIYPKWANLAYFWDQDVDRLRSLCANASHHSKFLFEIINRMCDNGSVFHTSALSNIIEIDYVKNIREIRRMFRENNADKR